MVAVVNHLHFTKPVEEFRAALEQEGLPLLSLLPGFVDFYFVRESDDRAIVLIFWDGTEAAEAGAKAFGPTWFAKNFAPYLAEKEERSVGEVIVRYTT